MEATYTFHGVKFPPEVIRKGCDAVAGLPRSDKASKFGFGSYLSVSFDEERWQHDSIDEFFADYRKDCANAHMSFGGTILDGGGGETYGLGIDWSWYGGYFPKTEVRVTAPTRAGILRVVEVLRSEIPNSEVFTSGGQESDWREKVRLFIGHGGNDAWRELSDLLEHQHGIQTSAFEFAATAGHSTRGVLEKLVRESSFAALVMTAEDQDSEGNMHARENVVHEAGLFQGALGFDRAIVLLEEGCAEFSNIHGVQQVRFKPGGIKSTVGELLSALMREFGPR
jgi:hypothetical protein